MPGRRIISRSFRGRAGGPKRATNWIQSTDVVAFTNVLPSVKLLHQSFAGTGGPAPFTVVRVRGLLSVLSDQFAATEEVFGALGMAIVSTVASGVGATAVPGPVTDAAWDGWFLHQPFTAGFAFASAVGFDGNNVRQFPLDSRAMRKVDPDDSIAVMIENGSDSFGFDFLLQFRMLLKMH